MSKTKSMDDYIRETRSYALQFEASGFKKTAEFMYDLADYLNSLPTPAVTVTNVGGKWISCSERLPDIDMSYPNAKDYLVYYEHGYYDVASYSNINRFWHEYTTEPYWNCTQYCKVAAWQPLPEPYKGE